ncbi:ribonuclease H [Bacillus phage AR9]|mgnify:FL=1|uniref:ribonuclease H n=2 Tax=Bacillus phage PBS1 TaxID=10683 RepID=A0A172JID5_BPPB1|nr:Rnase H [Bacillus phage AR9]YP_009664334.1 Rnase H [Bacillus phage PBS1]WCS68369.1 ribonuclease HI [Bacillus phage vB_BsuM-Goe21]AMS01325.1 ribonuclease H [Bacillus phage AR9]AST99954.1 RNaseH1 [Bacillus phage PBS1]BDE75530.1 ribonuclease H [Bacillus phage PBS1]
MKKIYIFSDAASFHNGKPDALGTCATLFVNEEFQLIGKRLKAFDKSTNNYNELMGVILGLKEMKDFVEKNPNEIGVIEIISDSEYTILGARDRLNKWIKNGWRNSSGEIKNLDLWKLLNEYKIYFARKRIILQFNWLRGHKGKNITLKDDPYTYYQEMADSLAVEYKERALKIRNGE